MNMGNLTGKIGEDYAAREYKKAGYRVVHRNFHSRYGEIDIIVQNEEFIVFAEVKARKIGSLTNPAEAVVKSKQGKIIKTAQIYLYSNPSFLQPRFDVFAVTTRNDKVISHELFESAFTL